MTYTVGISEMRTSNNRDDVLVTYSLGSCVGVALYDPVACVGGMVHCMLPLSKIDPAKARTNPCMFVDTGVPALIRAVLDMDVQAGNACGTARKACACGSTAVASRLIAKVAGAASLLDGQGTFNIGERNYIVLRQILWENHIQVAAEETGGTIARTLYLYMSSGRTMIKSRGEERELV